MQTLIKTAAGELGTEEIPGEKDNEQIVAYAQETGMDWINDDETAWCSIFMNWCAKKAGYERTGQANARSWLNVGKEVDVPEPGDTVIFWRKRRDSKLGHVGLFMGYGPDEDVIFCLGGNQGGQVSITEMPVDRKLGFRRLRKEGETHLPDTVLKEGDTGDQVRSVQEALNMAGYEAGPTDGIYGPKTTEAVTELQSTNDDLSVDGIYGPNTKEYLKGILDESSKT
jgi:uncharacterized protein (TIGR02594 family)